MEQNNLTELIENRLSPEAQVILQTAGLLAAESAAGLYLVGGVVRDLLLDRENLDLDLVVEGDAIALAYRMADTVGGKVTDHPRFRTATVKWEDRSIDFVTARSETYSRPGALPEVKPDRIAADLTRRDFTVNSMAVNLNSEKYGELLDPFDGRNDLQNRLIRILHEKSFIDDATRIWRAIRYEQRLDFSIEAGTLNLLKRDAGMLDTISRDRLRHELELVLREEKPEKALTRADELGALRNLHPGLDADDWLSGKLGEVCQLMKPDMPSPDICLALLVYRMDEDSIRNFIADLNFKKHQADVLTDVCTVKQKAEVINDDPLQPSAIHGNLSGLSLKALTAAMIAEESLAVKHNIRLYLDELRHVRTELTGADLKNMGVRSGSLIKTILDLVLDARLDREVTDRQGEIDRAREFIPE